GVQIEEVILHVGIGTFRPVQTQTLEDHVMHHEWVEITDATAERIRTAKSAGRRIVAVGTTSTRVLEGVAAMFGELRGYQGETNVFITPGFSFQVIDALITNFHLPKSTLLVLVSAFAGRENVLKAYEEAKANNYRFFSFGDAMFMA
ncbi:MAG: S-adenosylmethionine:tRNA ribosyltransferase-isomerase, partial [Candidatus Uhrbacteria bacterium]|nr:S-adenosylmethionine:tRNA ribosyltransferase-isomerase [Candidatus Uhrbacteria bacterium]